MPSKGGAVGVVVVVSAITTPCLGDSRKKNVKKVTSVIYNGFYVGTFPTPTPEVCVKKNTKNKPNNKRRTKRLSTKSKFAMMFEDRTVNSLVKNQKEKKQASLYKVVSHLNPVIVHLYPAFLMPAG